MKPYLKSKIDFFKKKEFLIPFFASFGMLFAANIINFYAGTYATVHASNSVTDIILNNIRVFDVDNLFVYGTLIFWTFLIIVWFHHIKKLPFSVKTLSLFIVIRSIFITLTHIGPFADQVAWTNFIISKWSFGGDLFFSGHTGIPFLFALIFWDNKPLRITFICASLYFATIVLLGHLHYSIDVLSAFFITYSIFHLAKFLFKKDLELFQEKSA
jgi:hypothetical protein